MNLDEWKSDTNAGRLAVRTDDLELVDRRLAAYLASPNSERLNSLRTAFTAWRNADLKGRATLFAATADRMQRWIAAETIRMTNKAAAEAAYAATLAHYEHDDEYRIVKSCNKIVEFPESPASYTVANLVRAAQSQISSEVSRIAMTSVNRIANIQQLRAQRFGNCSEMAFFAHDFLLGMIGGPTAAVIQFEPNNPAFPQPDHVFCVVGVGISRDPGDTSGAWLAISQSLVPNMDAWPADLWVVDPWATVCCAARDYFAEFERKAAAWAAMNLKVSYQGTWVNPNSHDYKNSLIHGRKTRIR